MPPRPARKAVPGRTLLSVMGKNIEKRGLRGKEETRDRGKLSEVSEDSGKRWQRRGLLLLLHLPFTERIRQVVPLCNNTITVTFFERRSHRYSYTWSTGWKTFSNLRSSTLAPSWKVPRVWMATRKTHICMYECLYMHVNIPTNISKTSNLSLLASCTYQFIRFFFYQHLCKLEYEWDRITKREYNVRKKRYRGGREGRGGFQTMKQAKKLKVQPTRLKNSQQILLPQENSNIKLR